jgi:predicted pyridoxine 5'-phosphate oxidase superfamily flavin-nucleotide-binding protein
MKVHQEIDDSLREFIEAQHVFFVATAPNESDGHVNVSPKGLAGSFRVLGPHRFAYLDYGGSGAETIAHLRQNGRITVMFGAFEGPPNIVRLFGTGRVIFADDPAFAELRDQFPVVHNRLRVIIDVDVTRVQDSCGYSVPFMTYESDRTRLTDNWVDRDPDALEAYWAAKNPVSIDGLPAMKPAAGSDTRTRGARDRVTATARPAAR